MRKLQNTLYVTTPTAYLSLEGENVVVTVEKEVRGRMPLHLLEGIVCFTYLGASPALLGKCADLGIGVTYLNPNGRFLAHSVGRVHGNVVLRREQYRIADSPARSLHIAQRIIAAKLMNTAAVLRRAVSDHGARIDADALLRTAEVARSGARAAYEASDAESLRGIEGECASRYFAVFNEMILQSKDVFRFDGRNRRPPLDPVNALLSFGYSLMASACTSALESVGLDSYVGIFHTERPGRCSLALDLLEEFRAAFVDRFILSLINRRELDGHAFLKKESGAVILTEEGRKTFLSAWQRKKQEEFVHPFLKERIPWGLLPHIQAMLLARFIRGDIDDYAPFIWR